MPVALYGGKTTQLLEFDENAKFLRKISKGVCGISCTHGARLDKYDKYDNFESSIPKGYVTMNPGRREGEQD